MDAKKEARRAELWKQLQQAYPSDRNYWAMVNEWNAITDPRNDNHHA